MWIPLLLFSVLVLLFLVLATRPDTRGQRLLVLGISGLVAAAVVVVLNWPTRSEAEVPCEDPRGCAWQPVAGSDSENPDPDPVEEGPDEVEVESPSEVGCANLKNCGGPVLNREPVDGGVIDPIECSDPKHCGDPRESVKN